MIYLIEDDNSIRELVVYTLNNSGLDAKGFALPSEFWTALHENTNEGIELIILDIMLPEESGLSILKKLRNGEIASEIPIMMLTAKSSEYDKVYGLDNGADDYMSKPFGMMELLARVKALLRRTSSKTSRVETSADNELEIYTIGKLSVNYPKHIVKADENVITLTAKEFELLYLLLKNQGTVFSRKQLLDRIWGYEFDGESRTVDVHIRTLRQKLGNCGDYIETVRGFGYKIVSNEKAGD